MNPNPELARFIDMDDPRAVLRETERIADAMSCSHVMPDVLRLFEDILDLFKGRFDGYQPCNTPYHDLKHTTDCFLAMARLLHGAYAEGAHLGAPVFRLGLMSALLHDTGYIQTLEETNGTGARFTSTHVRRSIRFTDKYFRFRRFKNTDAEAAGHIILCTDIATGINAIAFTKPEYAMAGKMLGAADLLGQMADRTYLEKLLFLWLEFKEGDIPGYASEIELLDKTLAFYNFVKNRLDRDLGGVHRFMRGHFKARWQLDKDVYSTAITNNMHHLQQLVSHHRSDYRKHLRRGNIVSKKR